MTMEVELINWLRKIDKRLDKLEEELDKLHEVADKIESQLDLHESFIKRIAIKLTRKLDIDRFFSESTKN